MSNTKELADPMCGEGPLTGLASHPPTCSILAWPRERRGLLSPSEVVPNAHPAPDFFFNFLKLPVIFMQVLVVLVHLWLG